MKRIFVALALVIGLVGCKGTQGPTGPAGPPGPSGITTTTHSGTILYVNAVFGPYSEIQSNSTVTTMYAASGSAVYQQLVGYDGATSTYPCSRVKYNTGEVYYYNSTVGDSYMIIINTPY